MLSKIFKASLFFPGVRHKSLLLPRSVCLSCVSKVIHEESVLDLAQRIFRISIFFSKSWNSSHPLMRYKVDSSKISKIYTWLLLKFAVSILPASLKGSTRRAKIVESNPAPWLTRNFFWCRLAFHVWYVVLLFSFLAIVCFPLCRTMVVILVFVDAVGVSASSNSIVVGIGKGAR